MAASSFVHLQCQSEYSVKNSLIRVPKLIESVQQAGMDSVALTDDMSLFSAVKFYQTAIDSGVKPIICLLYTSPSPRDQRGYRMPSSA